ncbi:MAG: Polyketide cyclase / dehydrase and lipid transport [Candidatus Saccharibacteria bacterium]|nr:Polyketide cyclase / dehydrase and lipid transport [Candidatus Saccharibacteria bacterium]
MKARVITQVSIAASPAEIFRYLAQVKHHHLWNPHLVHVSSMKTLKLDAHYDADSILFGINVTATNVVTKFVKNEELELENKAGPLEYQVNYQLHAKGKKTLLICATTVSSDSNAWTFAKPMLKLVAKHELRTDLDLLKHVVENRLS